MSSTVEAATEIPPFHAEIPQDGVDDLRVLSLVGSAIHAVPVAT